MVFRKHFLRFAKQNEIDDDGGNRQDTADDRDDAGNLAAVADERIDEGDGRGSQPDVHEQGTGLFAILAYCGVVKTVGQIDDARADKVLRLLIKLLFSLE